MTPGTADVPPTKPAERAESGSEPQAAPLPAAGDLRVVHRQPARELVRTIGCPTCGVAGGTPCQGRRGPRKSHHLARVERFVELRGQRLELSRTWSPDGGSAGRVKARSADPEGVDTVEADAKMRQVLDSGSR